MEENVREFTAYCGLYCADCIRYGSRVSALAGELLRELQATEFEEYARLKCSPARQLDKVKQFRHYRECIEVLEAIMYLRCDTPCRTGGGCSFFQCEIAACCREQGLEGCWQCAVFETCGKFAGLQSIHGSAPVENLKKIKALGLGGWAEERCPPYVWQQKKSP